MSWNGIIVGMLLAASSIGNAPSSYGCWSIKDQVERLACFDEAVGPPGAGIKEARPAPAEQVRDSATRPPN
ncbi:type VI secretion protein [Hyphomicrobiales bacterium BP6-180914]|uniref:Type VI secretion protein n=1 Tax=Lichenifustis flavocetrariae TaxID=2949735 RepID=A0AA42CGW6_9HYPH|nr:type VI secretion protein [Lichenifustis flavocetrariae]